MNTLHEGPARKQLPKEEALFLLLELNDALFPIGAYAHSYGLETYVQAGAVHDRQTAELWLRAYFFGSFLYSELLAARLAYEAYGSREAADAADASADAVTVDQQSSDGTAVLNQDAIVAKLLHLEQELVAAKAPREPREALQKLGRRLAKNVDRIGLPLSPVFRDYMTKAAKNCTHPVCYGALAADLGLPEREALLHYAYAQLSALTNTCVKLIPLSQTDGATIVADFRTTYSQLIDRVMDASPDDLGRSSPGLDIRAMEHETLYSRLYMS